jgi:AraC-like DNA-binding protein
MRDRSYSFYRPEPRRFEVEKDMPVEIISTGHERRSSREYRWDNERHSHARAHIFQYTLAGSGYFEFDRGERRERRRVEGGMMFIASWDRSFEYYFGGGEAWEFVWITLAGGFADRVVEALREGGPIVDIPADSAPALFLRDLQERLAGSSRIDHYALTILGYEFLVQLLREGSRSAATPEEVFLAEARYFVTRDIRSASVGSLARHFGYGEKYFNGYFKKRASTTPNRFITEQRLRYASSLLVNTRKKIAVVAEETGFSEDNYFSKVFKKHYGVSPAAYRERDKDAVSVNEIVIL